MIKVILRLDCGVGMSSADAYLVSEEDWAAHENPANPHCADYLATYSWEAAVEFASSYGIYPMSEQPEEFDEDEDQGGYQQDEYSEDINGWFELYSPEEHDGLKVGSGEWEFKEL